MILEFCLQEGVNREWFPEQMTKAEKVIIKRTIRHGMSDQLSKVRTAVLQEEQLEKERSEGERLALAEKNNNQDNENVGDGTGEMDDTES